MIFLSNNLETEFTNCNSFTFFKLACFFIFLFDETILLFFLFSVWNWITLFFIFCCCYFCKKKSSFRLRFFTRKMLQTDVFSKFYCFFSRFGSTEKTKKADWILFPLVISGFFHGVIAALLCIYMCWREILSVYLFPFCSSQLQTCS